MKLIGRDKEIEAIEDALLVHRCGMHPGDAPIGAYMLAGPSGCGKTRTVEHLAWKWHGNPKAFVKVDCGEFQMEHEVAKLIGAPPGYLGHRETVPMLNQNRINAVTSQNCNVSLVLFDEIEKAAPSMQRLLLGVLDKAALRLGDNTVVNFEKSIIFFTSNLGTRGLFKKNMFEFAPTEQTEVKNQEIKRALRGHFPPEFLNRLSDVFVYHPLTAAESRSVVEVELERMGHMLESRFVNLTVTFDSSLVEKMFELGFNREYGGRELKRAIYRNVSVPLARWASKLGKNFSNMTIALSWDGALKIEQLPAVGPTVTAGARRAGKGRE